jgi:hypothetical protein
LVWCRSGLSPAAQLKRPGSARPFAFWSLLPTRSGYSLVSRPWDYPVTLGGLTDRARGPQSDLGEEMRQQERQQRASALEIIIAVTLAILSIGSFALQVYWSDEQTTQRETALFSAIQFVLTVGFGWFSTRALSRIEFERSLKRFAIGAYRRITDIEAMIERLRQRVRDEVQSGASAGIPSTTSTVNAVLEDTLQVVRSSTADWADVIGDELLTLETISSLRRQKGVLEAEVSTEVENSARMLRDLDTRIEKLLQSLPADLQIESRRKADDAYHRRHAAEWMKRLHEQQGGLLLTVIAGGQWRCDGDPKALGEHMLLSIVAQNSVDVFDSSGVIMGRVLNNSPLDYDNFRVALCNCYGNPTVDIKFVRQVSQRMDKEGLVCWYEIRVAANPLQEVTDGPHAPTRTPRPRPKLKSISTRAQ